MRVIPTEQIPESTRINHNDSLSRGVPMRRLWFSTLFIVTTFIVTLVSASAAQDQSSVNGAQLLQLLPDGEYKREFILNCTGCHMPDYILRRNGWMNADQWETRIRQMIGYYGPHAGFPIITEGEITADPAALAEWLTAYWNADTVLPESTRIGGDPPVEITSYPFPGVGPHDLALVEDGTVLITGMHSGDMWRLDPQTGLFEELPLTGQAEPRALAALGDGRWWLVFGSQRQLVLFDPVTGDLDRHNIGFYAHSVGVDADGNAWANAHFDDDPVRIARVAPDSHQMTVYDLPGREIQLPGLPISYDLIVASDGIVWTSELVGNRLVRLDPESGETQAYMLPHSASGPRRFDEDRQGRLWIPEFSGGRLAVFDPSDESWREFDLPTPDCAPYIAQVDDANERVWVTCGASNSLVRFDMAAETMIEYSLPFGSALMRHMFVDPANGDVWVSTHHVPTVDDRIIRLRVLE